MARPAFSRVQVLERNRRNKGQIDMRTPPFALRMELREPIIPGRRLMLDGLLSALLFERTGDAAAGC